ncbi:TPA: HNH endonuclease [Klebsiella pneumoniae]
MKKLTTPIKVNNININIESTLDAIFSSCTQDGVKELRVLRDEWLLELNNYPIEMQSSKRLIASNHKSFEKHKKILLWLYDNPLASRKTSYIKELRNAYIEEGITCPYCGIGTATTLDHYYCKSSLPQFSILKENLIPCCGECNKTKGTLKPKKNGKEFLIPILMISRTKLALPQL